MAFVLHCQSAHVWNQGISWLDITGDIEHFFEIWSHHIFFNSYTNTSDTNDIYCFSLLFPFYVNECMVSPLAWLACVAFSTVFSCGERIILFPSLFQLPTFGARVWGGGRGGYLFQQLIHVIIREFIFCLFSICFQQNGFCIALLIKI